MSNNKTSKVMSSESSFLQGTARLYLYQKVCIFMVAFLVFANGISNDFNLDDIYYTTTQNALADLGIKGIPKIFGEHTMHDNNGNKFDYRPVPMLTFALQHQLGWGGATMGHFINVCLYGMICMLLFVLLCRWLGQERHWLAFFAVLIYAVHPLHTEVVDSIKSRDELLASMFGILMLLAVWKWYHTGKVVPFVLAGVYVLLGLLCKTTVVVYVGVMPVAFYFFGKEVSVKKIVIAFVGLFMLGLMLKLGLKFTLPEPRRVFVFFENPLYTDMGVPFSVKTATASYILGWYAKLHVLPYPLSFYYGYAYVGMLYWSLLPTLSLALHVVLVWLAFRHIRRKTVVAFGAMFYLIGIVLFSNMVGASPGMMAERFTFASSIGYCLLLVAALYQLLKVAPVNTFADVRGKYVVSACALVFVCYSGLTLQRNTQWKDTWTLYSHDVKHLQNSAKVNMLYAEQLMYKMGIFRVMIANTAGAEQKVYKDSLAMFQNEQRNAYLRVISIAPDYYEVLINLGVAYINLDSFELAKKYLVHARAVTPDNAVARANLGVAFGRLGAQAPAYLDSAASEFKVALGLNPKLSIAYSGLTFNYLVKGDTAAAVEVAKRAAKEIPDESSMYMQLGQLYLYKRDTAQGIAYYEQGAAIKNADPIIFQVLRAYYHSKGNTEKEKYYATRMLVAN